MVVVFRWVVFFITLFIFTALQAHSNDSANDGASNSRCRKALRAMNDANASFYKLEVDRMIRALDFNNFTRARPELGLPYDLVEVHNLTQEELLNKQFVPKDLVRNAEAELSDIAKALSKAENENDVAWLFARASLVIYLMEFAPYPTRDLEEGHAMVTMMSMVSLLVIVFHMSHDIILPEIYFKDSNIFTAQAEMGQVVYHSLEHALGGPPKVGGRMFLDDIPYIAFKQLVAMSIVFWSNKIFPWAEIKTNINEMFWRRKTSKNLTRHFIGELQASGVPTEFSNGKQKEFYKYLATQWKEEMGEVPPKRYLSLNLTRMILSLTYRLTKRVILGPINGALKKPAEVRPKKVAQRTGRSGIPENVRPAESILARRRNEQRVQDEQQPTSQSPIQQQISLPPLQITLKPQESSSTNYDLPRFRRKSKGQEN